MPYPRSLNTHVTIGSCSCTTVASSPRLSINPPSPWITTVRPARCRGRPRWRAGAPGRSPPRPAASTCAARRPRAGGWPTRSRPRSSPSRRWRRGRATPRIVAIIAAWSAPIASVASARTSASGRRGRRRGTPRPRRRADDRRARRSMAREGEVGVGDDAEIDRVEAVDHARIGIEVDQPAGDRQRHLQVAGQLEARADREHGVGGRDHRVEPRSCRRSGPSASGWSSGIGAAALDRRQHRRAQALGELAPARPTHRSTPRRRRPRSTAASSRRAVGGARDVAPVGRRPQRRLDRRHDSTSPRPCWRSIGISTAPGRGRPDSTSRATRTIAVAISAWWSTCSARRVTVRSMSSWRSASWIVLRPLPSQRVSDWPVSEQHPRRRVVRLEQATHRVRRAGAGADERHTEPAGGAGIPVGAVHRTLLVAGRHEPQVVGAGDGVDDRQVVHADDAEHVLERPSASERGDDCLAAGHHDRSDVDRPAHSLLL